VLDTVDAVVDIKKLKQATREIVKDESRDMDDKAFQKLQKELTEACTVELKK
jgi:hypothetical protein